MDTLIREKTDGSEEIWYSEKYLEEQIKLAYEAGVAEAVGIQFHAITPMGENNLNEILSKFKDMVKEEYLSRFGKGRVWRVGEKKMGVYD